MRDSPGRRQFADFLDKHGISLTKAAHALGVAVPTIHAWVNGAKSPNVDHRKAIAVWTQGRVSERSWETAEERAARKIVKPFAARPSRRTSSEA